ncbi:component of SufBCD complex [Mesobacterium sp. TK19101]|uniref:Component of SufBCD complex n=1 Tax=Mesobacterium hydrothermale TaxID=3111907 RepID=A0ABU6HDN9_9RHOB|nr:component of SufBCD complex [Mesobacterium sp. TK19101]MEC3860572.1 component of SufBCD complex [Mesobacterium sp. TK19101]
MDWQTIVFEVIDMRSFSNLWFWIALAVMWSSASHWVMGVPFDMVTRARRQGGQAEADLADMVRINCNRLLYIAGVSGLILIAAISFILTMLGVLGFAYKVEFAQAVFLLAFPMAIVFGLSIRTARRIGAQQMQPEGLAKLLTRHRIVIQAIGMVSIFVTALWGMFQNLSHGLLVN